ncbi:ATP-dependent helicase [Gloeocapsopsis crepidinum LEGE 06123]|uniref:DNA 3'-5' helicase n=1 Tax=Gloeocapsopsis crepidinum LEGE 06123 TaxID=588587 RepID=A0ABR9USY5_9CHRO|nr:UvrD-helicase domain-containing protein [Gloeocapsopsis crepidinum]MBE9191389.1 ATP-dependent helicase [Gloeocapsopsis crepidinum LEGE 06123]
MFTPSKYQTAIFDWVTNGRGDAVIEAYAGSGKTTTLVEAASRLRSEKATFLAFNKHVAKELQLRIGKSMACKTIHSIGMSTIRNHLGNAIVDEHKYTDIARDYAKEIAEGLFSRYQLALKQWARSKNRDTKEPKDPPTATFIANQLKQLAHFCMVTLTPFHDYDAVEATIAHFNCLDDSLDLRTLHYPLVSLLRDGERMAADSATISYDDMLWLPYQWNLTPSKQEWIFIDECQDLSPAQLDLVLKMRGSGGRLLFVGDRHQAIYGFAGASSDSFDQIIEKTQATILPLSICYRCPKKHIKLAQKLVPQIEAAPNAIEGVVRHIPRTKVSKIIREGDLVVSRCTAPAINLCIELIAQRIPARVRGRDIGKSLTAIVREVGSDPDFDFEHFGKFLEEYKETKIAKLAQRKNSESQQQSLCDRLDGIWICYKSFNSQNIEQFCQEIEQLFSDVRSSVVLSTVHRAKGLEEKRVFILRPDQLPLKYPNQQDWEKDQEENLKYVALTRAKEELYFIKEDEPSEDEEEEQPEIEVTIEYLQPDQVIPKVSQMFEPKTEILPRQSKTLCQNYSKRDKSTFGIKR